MAPRYYFATTQFVEVLPLPKSGASIQRLDHVAFTTADAEGLRGYLAASGIHVPASVNLASDSRWFEVRDPEGNRIQFVESSARATLTAAQQCPLQSHHSCGLHRA